MEIAYNIFINISLVWHKVTMMGESGKIKLIPEFMRLLICGPRWVLGILQVLD